MIKVTCYGEEICFKNRKKAIEYFKKGLSYCDPSSSEYTRYYYIITKLEQGNNVVSDEDY